MSRITHTVASSSSCGIFRASVTVPAIPGLSLDNDRSATAPRSPMICRPKRRGTHGAALRQVHAPIINARIQAIREALEADE